MNRFAFSILPLVALLALGVVALRERAQADEPAKKHKANTPVVANNPRVPEWPNLFKKFTERAKQGNIDLLFLGDSITEGWTGRRGKEVWDKHYGKRNAYNMGIGGDRTEHVLYRILNGNVDGISPKLVVVMIGCNNAYFDEYTPEMIGDGMVAIVDALKEKLPKSKILFLATLPVRDGSSGKKRTAICAKASAMVEKLADNKTLFYMDIGSKFINADDGIDKDVLYDGCHPATKGYEIWATAIEDKVAELMGEKK